MKTFLLNDEFQKSACVILVIAVILMFLYDVCRGERETAEATESPVVVFQEERVVPSLVGQPIDTVERERSIILIHSDKPEEWGQILADDGLGNVGVGFNRREGLAETEVLP